MTTEHKELADFCLPEAVEEHEREEFECTSLQPECKEENIPFLMPDYFTQRMKKLNVNQVSNQVSRQMEVTCTQHKGSKGNTTNASVANHDRLGKVEKGSDIEVNNEVDYELLQSLEELTNCFDKTTNTSVVEPNNEFAIKMEKYKSIRYHSLPLCSYLLQTYFHINDGQFKPRQDEVCLSVLHHVNTLAVCPTGWGKSLCYQFPMLVHRLLFRLRYKQWLLSRQQKHQQEELEKQQHSFVNTNESTNTVNELRMTECHSTHNSRAEYTDSEFPERLHSKVCLVVSPLLSLMADQTSKINETNVLKAITLSSQMSKDRFQSITRELLSPLCEIDIIFISPERLVSDMALRELLLQRQAYRLALVCIDEVHCLSQWGFDFRPSYMYISRLWETTRVQKREQEEEKEEEYQKYKQRYQNIRHTNSTCMNIINNNNDVNVVSSECNSKCLHSPTILCLTATATCDVIHDIEERFDIAHTVICTTPREHLKLEAINLIAYNEEDKSACEDSKHDGNANNYGQCGTNTRIERAWLDALVQSAQSLPTPMLIYVQTRAAADEIANLLGQKLHVLDVHASCTKSNSGNSKSCSSEKAVLEEEIEEKLLQKEYKVFTTEHERRAIHKSCTENKEHDNKSVNTSHSRVVRCYHAALSHSLRKSTQRQFANGEIDILVATVAFGMGIDMPHIRTVLHASAPSSIEHYIQETGRAGRDGEKSVCRLLYNPLEYYELRNRLLSSYISPIEMEIIVARLLAYPFTHYGEKLMFISPSKLATEMEISEEAIETVLFMLLSRIKNKRNNGTAHITNVKKKKKQQQNILCTNKHRENIARSVDKSINNSKKSNITTDTTDECRREFAETNNESKEWNVFEHLYGQTVQSYTLHRSDSENETHESNTDNNNNNNSSRKRSRYDKEKVTGRSYAPTLLVGATSCNNNFASTSMCKAGVSMLLQQLNVKDLVLEYCRKNTRIDNIIEMANQLKMTLTDVQFRLNELIESGCICPRRTQNAYLLTLSSMHEENINVPERILELVDHLYNQYNEHLEHKLYALSEMFTILAHPTHEALQASLNTPYDKATRQDNTNWMSNITHMTNTTRMKKMDAVAIANSFVEQNRQRIHNVYEAARALLGIRPRSVIKYGKYAGQLPLSTVWYVNSPYFGALREFDLQWVLTILKAHNLDAQE